MNFKEKLMKKFFLAFLLGVGCINVVLANIDIILEDEINFANAQGVVSANVIYNKQTFQALGTYKMSKDLKVVFEVDRLMKGQKLSILDKKPRVTKRLNNANTKLPKGTKLTLKGENQKEFREFAEQVKELEKGSAGGGSSGRGGGSMGGGSAGGGSTQSIPSGSNSGGSIGNVSIGGGGAGTGTIMPPYINTGRGSSGERGSGGGSMGGAITGGSNNGGSTWSSQFCEPPTFVDNGVKLVIVDKDGKCVEKMGQRDDSKCEYRLDFAHNKAIKQTQYYYVDNESTIQTVGDCVDLVGAEYEAELYKDDTRCSTEDTDKNYGGGVGRFFVTQVLFRGIDGLIHEATDCIAYGNIKEELVEHTLDNNARTAQRVVNQFYIDPYTNEKIYIAKGVRTDSLFNWTEIYCGDWEMNDTEKQGRKRTQIVFYDEVEYKQFDVTSCDFSNQMGKKTEYVIPYQNLSSTYKEQELSRKSVTHNIDKREIKDTRESWREKCGWFSTCGRSASNFVQELKQNINWTTTYVTKDVTDYEVWLRPDGTEYKYNKNPNGNQEIFKRIDREVKVNNNTANLTLDWLLYWEIHNKHYSDPTTEQSNPYQSWLSSKYSQNITPTTTEYCQNYSIVNHYHADDSWSCATPLKYDLTNP